MAEESQLVALQKACEAQEKEIAAKKKEVSEVRMAREKIVQDLEGECDKLSKKISQLLEVDRFAAVRMDKPARSRSVVEYAERVKLERRQREEVLSEKRRELEMAVARERLVEEELLAARLESRRVEKLLEDRSLQSLVHKDAIDEVTVDEFSSTILKRSS